MAGLERLIYVDDSYDDKHSGVIVFGWVECSPQGWRVALRAWLELRKQLFSEFTVPPSAELHATKFINGRDQLVTDEGALDPSFIGPEGQLLKKDLGRAIAVRCLEAIKACPDLRVGAVYTQTEARGPEFAVEKYALYERLVLEWDRELAEADVYALITMDGQDSHYLDAHRGLKLDQRHIIEDPAMHDSRRSQWVQMADLVAYVALMTLNQHAHNQFGWTWYADHLTGSDAHAGPRHL